MTRLGALTPLTAARAGTVNDAGGLLTDVDCRGYKSIMVVLEAGVVGTSVDLTVNDSTASGGTYAEMKTAAGVADGHITQIGASGPGHAVINHNLMPGRPWVQLVLVTVGATTATSVTIYGHGIDQTNRV